MTYYPVIKIPDKIEYLILNGVEIKEVYKIEV